MAGLDDSHSKMKRRREIGISHVYDGVAEVNPGHFKGWDFFGVRRWRRRDSIRLIVQARLDADPLARQARDSQNLAEHRRLLCRSPHASRRSVAISKGSTQPRRLD